MWAGDHGSEEQLKDIKSECGDSFVGSHGKLYNGFGRTRKVENNLIFFFVVGIYLKCSGTTRKKCTYTLFNFFFLGLVEHKSSW